MGIAVRTIGLTRRYNMGTTWVEALTGVDLAVEASQFVALVGPSGSGKSTTLNLIGGLDRPTAGEIWVDGIEISAGNQQELIAHRRHRVGFVFQTFNLLPRLTAWENVALPLMFVGAPEGERQERARALLEQVGLGDRLHHRPTQLSGGEQQRVAIARALIGQPALLLADEPTGNLDTTTGMEIMALLRQLNRERGLTLLVVTHDPEVAAFADRVVRLRDGRVEPSPQDEGLEVSPQFSSPPTAENQRGRMSLRDSITTALSNLGRHKVRTVLTAVGVTVGILTIVTMMSLGIGVQREMIRNFESIGLETLTISPKTEERTAFNQFGEPRRTKIISVALVEEIRAMEQVVDVIPRISLPYSMNVLLDISGEQGKVQWITDPDNDGPSGPFEPPVEILAGRQITWDQQGYIVLAESVLKDLEEDYQGLVGREVKLVLRAPRGNSQTFSFTVAGVVSGQRGVVIGLADQLAMKAWWYNDPDLLQTQGYDSLTVKTRSLNDATQVLDRLQEMGFEVRSLKAVMDMANRGIIILQTMLGSVGGLALLVASIGIANTMIMAVYERTREIGILKAVGAAPRQIRGLFVLEASLIGLLGGVAGTIGGWLLGLALNRLILFILAWQGIDFPPTQFFAIAWWLVALALAFAVLVGLLAGLYPAARAARLDPLEALRYE